MKPRAVVQAVLILIAMSLAAHPAWAVNKETLQLLQQVSAIQQQLRDLQDGQIKSNAIIQKLTEQILDQVTRLSASIDDIKKSNAQTQAAISSKVDSFAGNLQITQEGLDEIKARLTRLSTDLAGIKSTVQSIDSKLASGTPSSSTGTTGENASAMPTQSPVTNAPPESPDVLYDTALKDYLSSRYKLAFDEFRQYLKYYPTTPLAGNAQFYIGHIYFLQERYEDAIREFNVVVERYSEGTKVTQAIYKKGQALVKLDQKSAAIREFRLILSRYPASQEAKLAAQELAKLSPPGGSAASRRTPPRRKR